MNEFDDIFEDSAERNMELLLSYCAAVITDSEDANEFLRWFRSYAAVYAPEMFAPFENDPDALRSFLSIFARYIWNLTPLPGNHFRSRPLDKPERNASCPCGSGRKYKQCCAPMEQANPAMQGLSMLPYVLGNLTAKQLAAIPYAYLAPEELAHVAELWMDKGRVQETVKLLEGLFADINKLDERAEPAFDRLLDCYDQLQNPRKKKQLLKRGFAATNKYLRGAAMQRQCCIYSDRNEYDKAWQLFQELQRLLPNDPSLAHLEVVILHSQGDKQRTAERAKFWIARLTRDKDPAYENLIAFLRSFAVGDAAGAMMGIAREVNPVMDKLVNFIRKLPQPVCHYTLKTIGDSAGLLMPDDKVRHLVMQWEARAESALEISDDIKWLEQHPLAWQSFEILDEWAEALDSYWTLRGFEEVVLIPLLRHAEYLLRKIIEQHHAEKFKLEWSSIANRPALRLLGRLAMQMRTQKNFAESVRVMEWMVLTLNPNDNQGMRDFLIHDYLRVGRVADAVALGERYPGDMGAIGYGAALALFMAGQNEEAKEAINIANSYYPEIHKMLLADNPRQPKLMDGMVKVGGKDEAWFYRKDHLDIWQTSGGLEWLRQQSGRMKRK